mmetsp:Transcript_31051/g.41035  ORF Transcript_31051/g.41035 Transcript_31051/m.41035 type:complete len:459 (-) Transcript_31051:523-1899(-)
MFRSKILPAVILVNGLIKSSGFLESRSVGGFKPSVLSNFKIEMHINDNRINHRSFTTMVSDANFKPLSFEFTSADNIIFGSGSAERIPDIASSMGCSSVLVITGQSGQTRHSDICTSLESKGLKCWNFVVSREPTISDIEEGSVLAREAGVDLVVGVGGGSVIDAGKAISALITNKEEVLHYLEVVGRGQPLTENPVPYIAVPTTAGTGSEVTKNAVIKSEEHNIKASLRSAKMLPTVAIVDPLLTVGCPPSVTAHTGLDALCQCIEPYVSGMANPFTDALAKQGMASAARSLRKAVIDGNDIRAREDMALASVLGGLALANAKLGAVHGFAGVLGGMYEKAPHGAICAALLPHAFTVNVQALTREVNSGKSEYQTYLDRHVEVAQIITGNINASAEDGARWLQEIAKDLGIPSLAEIGMTPDDYDKAVEFSAKSSSMKGNPIELSTEELLQILKAAV